jgi:hypothetical protein
VTVPRPGTDIIIVDEAAPSGAILDTGQAFMVGATGRGPTDRAEKITSASRYEAVYGDRSGGALMSDAVGAYFSEGGGVLYVSRATGSGAAAASVAFGSLTADAASAGAWGDDLTVSAEAPSTLSETIGAQRLEARAAGDPVVIVVALDGTNVERSPVVADADSAVNWAAGSDYVRLAKGADNLVPVAGTTADLTGGADGGAPGASDIAAALGRFDSAYGPGQVLAPGLTQTAVHEELLAHVAATRRCALVDLPDSSDPTVLGAAVAALENIDGVRFTSAWAPWATYPGPAGSQVTVPYAAVEAALIAQADRATGNPNQPAAGANGVCRYALGLAQEFTDAQREALNGAGVCMAKVVYGDVRSYGYRTAAGPADTNWLWFGNSRVVMAVAHESEAIAENYVLRQIDGRGQLFAALEADLRGVCLRHFNAGALYGASPEEAFAVDTGSAVNTPETITNGEVHAVIRLKCSPAAEWVVIEIVKVPVERALPTTVAA